MLVDIKYYSPRGTTGLVLLTALAWKCGTSLLPFSVGYELCACRNGLVNIISYTGRYMSEMDVVHF